MPDAYDIPAFEKYKPQPISKPNDPIGQIVRDAYYGVSQPKPSPIDRPDLQSHGGGGSSSSSSPTSVTTLLGLPEPKPLPFLTPTPSPINRPDLQSHPPTIDLHILAPTPLPNTVVFNPATQYQSGTLQGMTNKEFEANRQQQESVDYVFNVIKNPALPFEEASRKTGESSYDYGGTVKRYGYEEEGFNKLLPEKTRGTSSYGSRQLSYEELGKINYGGGQKGAVEQAQSKADIQATIYADVKSRNDLDLVQGLYDSKSISAEQATDMLKKYNDNLNNELKNIYDTEFNKMSSEFTKGRDSVKTNEMIVSNIIATVPFAVGGFISGASGGVGLISKSIGLVSLGKEGYSSVKDLISGDYSKFPDRAINLAVGGGLYGLGYKLGFESVYRPSVINALESSQLHVTTSGKGFDINIDRYGFDEKGMLEINKLIDKGYTVNEIQFKLLASSKANEKYLPKVEGVGLDLTKTDKGLFESNTIGRLSSESKGKIVESDIVGITKGKSDGNIIESGTVIRTGKLGETNPEKITQVESFDSALIEQINKGGLTSREIEGILRTELKYSGKARELPFKDKVIVDNLINDIQRLSNKKSIKTTEGEFRFKEDITGVTFNKKGFTGDVIDSGGLLSSGRTKVIEGSYIEQPSVKKISKIYKDLPIEEKLPIRNEKVSSYIPEEIKNQIGQNEVSSFFGEIPKDLLSKSLYGEGYGINYGGGYKRALIDIGIEQVNSMKTPIVLNKPIFDNKGLEVTNIIPKYIDRIEINSKVDLKISDKIDDIIKQGEDYVNRQSSNQGSVQKVDFGQIQITEHGISEIPKQSSKLVEPTMTTMRMPYITFPPFAFGISTKESAMSKRKRLNPAYLLQVKRRGKFQNVQGGLTRGNALSLGEDIVTHELSRQFRLVPKGTTEEEDLGFIPSETIFRKYRVRRGQKIYDVDTFIQRASANLQTISEKQLLRQSRQFRKSYKGALT